MCPGSKTKNKRSAASLSGINRVSMTPNRYNSAYKFVNNEVELYKEFTNKLNNLSTNNQEEYNDCLSSFIQVIDSKIKN